jgi:predicted nucleic acid-binding protein
MPIKVRANVVDLRSDTPQKDDVFFVDSNVWYWIGYTNASLSSNFNQSNDYPNYVGQALNEGSTLYKCTLSFAELAHSIERSERNIFNGSRKPPVSAKDFRHNYPIQRQAVITEIENSWTLVEDMTGENTIEVNLTDSAVQQSLARLKSEALDGYDAFMVEAIFAKKSINQVITDDSDFGQIAGITVFTANDKLVNAAKDQKKLLKR